MDESRLWISSLKASGGSNLLSALKVVGNLATEFNSVLVVVGSPPDQTADIAVDYFLQAAAGKSLPVHAVRKTNSGEGGLTGVEQSATDDIS